MFWSDWSEPVYWGSLKNNDTTGNLPYRITSLSVLYLPRVLQLIKTKSCRQTLYTLHQTRKYGVTPCARALTLNALLHIAYSHVFRDASLDWMFLKKIDVHVESEEFVIENLSTTIFFFPQPVSHLMINYT